MKKSKILAISLGAITATAITVATPLIVTSCNSSSNSTPSIILGDKFISFHNPGNLKPNNPRATIEKEKDTNNWNYYVGDETLAKQQLAPVYFDVTKMMTRDQYNSLGFDSKNVNGWITASKDGKDIEVNNGCSAAFDESADKTKPQKIEFKLWIFEGTNPSNIGKKVEIPFSITMIPGLKQQ